MPTEKQKKNWLVLPCILAVCLCLMILAGAQKKGLHSDELLTYELSNGYYQPWMLWYEPNYTAEQMMHEHILGTNPVDTVSKWSDVLLDIKQNGIKGSDFYRDYRCLVDQADMAVGPTWHEGTYFANTLTVQPGQRFNVASVYYNQGADTHPPLYYLLVHFISSLFPNRFSKWFALSVNFAAMLGTLTALYRLTKRWFGGEKSAALVTLGYGLSHAALSTAELLRMYSLLTLFTTLLLSYCLDILLEPDATASRKWRAGFFFTVLFGFTTQYYFVIFAVGATLVVLPALALQKRWKKAGAYIFWAALAGLVSICIWPFSLRHIFSGYRGAESVQNLGGGENLLALRDFAKGCFEVLLHSSWLLLAFFGIVLAAAAVLLASRQGIDKRQGLVKYAVPAVAALFHFLVVSQISTIHSARYVYCAFPAVFLVGIKAAEGVGRWLNEKCAGVSASLLASLAIVFTVVSLPGLQNYPAQENRIARAQENAGAQALYYCEDRNDWTWASVLPDLKYYSRTAMVMEKYGDWIGENVAVQPGDTLMVYICNTLEQQQAQKTILQQLDAVPNSVEQLPAGSDLYATVYIMKF